MLDRFDGFLLTSMIYARYVFGGFYAGLIVITLYISFTFRISNSDSAELALYYGVATLSLWQLKRLERLFDRKYSGLIPLRKLLSRRVATFNKF